MSIENGQKLSNFLLRLSSREKKRIKIDVIRIGLI